MTSEDSLTEARGQSLDATFQAIGELVRLTGQPATAEGAAGIPDLFRRYVGIAPPGVLASGRAARVGDRLLAVRQER